MYTIDHRCPSPAGLPRRWRAKVQVAVRSIPDVRSVRVALVGSDILLTVVSRSGWSDAERARADRAIATALKPRAPRKTRGDS